MKKLKDILLEGYAWERKADGSLPTLKDAIATHRSNLSESEKSLSDLEYAVKQHERDNHVYDKTKLTNIYNQLSDMDQKTAKTKFSKYFGSADAVKAKIAKLEKEIADLKHQYYKDSNLSPEREKQLRKQMGEKGRELKRAKREDRTGSAGYNPNPERKAPTSPSSKPKPDFLDLDKDGNTEEPMKDAADDMNEAFWKRVKENLYGHDYSLRESFRK